MGRSARYILIRVAIGMLIGIGMFYFKSAHAQTCPAGQTSGFKPTSQPTGSYGFTLLCALQSVHSTKVALANACLPAGTISPTSPSVKIKTAIQIDGGTYIGAELGRVSDNGGIGTITYNIATACYTPCTAGQLIGTGSSSGSSSLSGGVCSSGCIATPNTTGGTVEVDIAGQKGFSTGTATTEWRLTGAACPTSNPPPAFKQSPTCVGLACAVAAPSAPAKATGNNTTINNTQNFYTHTDGSASVNSNTPTPPGPNGGESSVPATVTNSYTVTINGQPITYNYYTTQTINNSYNGDGSLGDRTTPVDADGDGTPRGTPTGQPVTPPDQPQEQECTGEDCEDGEGGEGAFTGPGGGTAREFGDSINAVKQAFNNSALVMQVSALQIPSGGTCPAPSINLPYLNTSVTMDSHCTVAAGIRSELRAIFLALWIIIAIGVFLRP